MLETSARLLALLSLLQVHREWRGADLAQRLGVSGRTLRNDIGRLHPLGYPVDATRGSAGGHRLGAGAELPPLLLDDEEAVAVAIGLAAASSRGIAGVEESSLRALARLEQVLPTRLRRRVDALRTFAVRVPRRQVPCGHTSFPHVSRISQGPCTPKQPPRGLAGGPPPGAAP